MDAFFDSAAARWRQEFSQRRRSRPISAMSSRFRRRTSSRPRRLTTGPASISACSAAMAGARPTPTRSAISTSTASTSAAMPAPTGSGAISCVGAEGDLVFPFRDGESGGIDAEQGLNGSLRGRAGIALDRFLLYGTAGGAGTDLELSSAAGSDEQTLWGWTAGAGVEGQITRQRHRAHRIPLHRLLRTRPSTSAARRWTAISDTHTIRGGVGLKF